MKRTLILLPALLLGACAEKEEAAPIYDTAGVQYRTLEVAVSSAGIVEPLATVEVKSKASGEVLAVLTAFARCFTELGIAMMVGGNILGRTRTLTTATALETARGEFARGVAMSLILLLIAMLVTVTVASLSRADREAAA